MPKALIYATLFALLLNLGTPVARAYEEDYVPASSGKRYTPLKGPELRAITGFFLGVPIFLNNRDVVRPGGDFNFWVGLDIGWLAFIGGFGASWNPIDLDGVAGNDSLGRSPLTRLYISPEIRLQVPKSKKVLPYVSGGFDANWWKHREVSTIACDFWYCSNPASFQFTPGFTGKVGMAIKGGSRVYVDLGMKYSMSGAGNFFEEVEWWLTPFVGVLYRGDPD